MKDKADTGIACCLLRTIVARLTTMLPVSLLVMGLAVPVAAQQANTEQQRVLDVARDQLAEAQDNLQRVNQTLSGMSPSDAGYVDMVRQRDEQADLVNNRLPTAINNLSDPDYWARQEMNFTTPVDSARIPAMHVRDAISVMSQDELRGLTQKGWDALDQKEREALATKVAQDAAFQMGVEDWQDVRIEFDPDLTTQEGSVIAGQYDPNSGLVQIRSSGPDWESPEQVVNTVLHEYRHRLQDDAKKGTQSLGSQLLDTAAANSYENYVGYDECPVGYYLNFIERDAVEYGDEAARVIMNEAYLNELDRLLTATLPPEVYRPGEILARSFDEIDDESIDAFVREQFSKQHAEAMMQMAGGVESALAASALLETVYPDESQADPKEEPSPELVDEFVEAAPESIDKPFDEAEPEPVEEPDEPDVDMEPEVVGDEEPKEDPEPEPGPDSDPEGEPGTDQEGEDDAWEREWQDFAEQFEQLSSDEQEAALEGMDEAQREELRRRIPSPPEAEPEPEPEPDPKFDAEPMEGSGEEMESEPVPYSGEEMEPTVAPDDPDSMDEGYRPSQSDMPGQWVSEGPYSSREYDAGTTIVDDEGTEFRKTDDGGWEQISERGQYGAITADQKKEWQREFERAQQDLRDEEPASPDLDRFTAPGEGALDRYADRRQDDRRQQVDSASTTMDMSRQMGESARAGDQQIRESRQMAEAAGRDAQTIQEDAARRSAQAQRDSSWGRVLGDAVTDGIQQGAEEFATTFGRAAADEAARRIFGPSREDRQAARDTAEAEARESQVATPPGAPASAQEPTQRRPSRDRQETAAPAESAGPEDPIGIRETQQNPDGTVTIRYGCGYSWSGTPPGPSRCPICDRETVSTEQTPAPAPPGEAAPSPSPPSPPSAPRQVTTITGQSS